MKNLKRTASVKLHGNENATEITAIVGSWIQLDDRATWGGLLPGDEPVDSGYAGADFRLDSVCVGTRPVNVFVTGRTVQTRGGSDMIRVKVEFVGDCEPSTFAKGWLGCASAKQDGARVIFAA